jgi:hypothetical protein
MFSNVLRDAELVDLARDAVAPLQVYLEGAAEVLAVGRRARGRRRDLLVGALRHALDFTTWHSLTTNGIGRSDAARLVTALVDAASAPDGDASVERRAGRAPGSAPEASAETEAVAGARST